ncbi:MIP/aquaporin family protein [Arthrobacter sp. ISL-72]|uniref:MIP/aquaporin family protein n=1 Tax=Arthrobacter sp. ISL-72 TaxID=2819114 RepID=UPI001BEB67C9|nr:aquaporin [Arthrobacter sp. ISL-72]MBT2595780.1 aquaporin [Arthrobacter sp. ISL-72]
MTSPVPAHPTPGPDLPAAPDAFKPGLVARLSAEAFGTLFLVIAGLGVPLFTIPQSNPLSASLAAGLAVTAAMLAFAYISGGHFNPAVTLGNAIAGRIRLPEAAAYLGAQLVGALAGTLALFGILRTVPKIEDTRAAFDTVTAGFGEHSIIQAPMAGVLLVEVLGAALLVAVFLGTTSARNTNKAAAPFAVGLTLAVLLQLGQAVGNTPFNPARATASAIFSNSWSLEQLWLFWVAPLVGAAIAGLVFRTFADTPAAVPAVLPARGPGAAGAAEPDSDEDDPDTLDALDGDLDGGPDGDRDEPKPAGSSPDDDAREFFDGKRGK